MKYVNRSGAHPGERGSLTSAESAGIDAVARARRATAAVFIGAGGLFAGWVSRIPQIRAELQLTTADLGLVLLALSVGSLLALPITAVLIRRFGTRAVVSAMAFVAGGSLIIVGVGYHADVLTVVAGLFLFGFGMAAWNVAMNVQAAVVERHAGRAIMPRFHAGYSIGTVGSALLSAGLITAGVSVTGHLVVIAVLISGIVAAAARTFLHDDAKTDSGDYNHEPAGGDAGRRRPRLDRRTLLIGVVVLAFAFAEGAGNDWIAVALVDDHNASPALASLAYATFLTAMTAGRWTGPALLNRYGRTATIRGLAVVALVGLLIFIVSPWPALSFVGVLLWGLGACLGFPVGLSAAADDPRSAAHRVSVVSGIGQIAFLGGPPLIGLLASHGTVQHALAVVPGLIAFALLATNALDRPKDGGGRNQPVQPV